jgi:phage gp29-like protein
VALQTLGIANLPGPVATAAGLEVGQVSQPSNLPTPAAPTGDEAVTSEVGATGTPIFSGFLRELGEYNAELTWPAAYMIYEQMRRSDAQVAATLWASKLPIRGGEWKIQAPKQPTPIEQEAADFVEQEVFDGAINFDAALENALLMLDFGASLHEDVWKIDGNRIRLAKMAARLPLTFYRWICDPGTDNLRVIEQLGYRAGQYVRTELPVEKCTLFTFRQEGANFTGQSLLRQMYQHWYIKSGLYRVDAIACERNGMGVPVITMAEAAKSGQSFKEDKDNALAWVQALTTHQRTGLVLPPGWLFALEGVKGNLRDPKESIAHHGTMIALVGLAQFMMMGQSSHGSGNRSLGETMSDFFFMGLQATADLIGRRFSDTTVKRLVDLNFAGVKRYPKLIPQQIMALKFDAIIDALAKLGTANIMTPTPELEAWLRERIGAPEADKAVIIRERAKRAVSIPNKTAGAGAQPGAEGGLGAGEGGSGGVTEGGQKNAKSGDSSGEGKVAASESTDLGLRRAPRGAEKCLALTEIVGALEQGRDDIAAALRAARPRVQAEIVHKLVDAPVRNMHRVSIAPDEKLTGEIEGILRGLADFGREQVAKERDRQRKGGRPADAAELRSAGQGRTSIPLSERGKQDSIGLYADGVVSEYQNNLQARATNIAIDKQRAGGKSKGELITEIGADLDDQSDKWIDNTASKGANEAFADGRDGGYEEYKDEIGSVVYSALLDINTCGACAGADGSEGATPEDIPGVPNPDCDGGDKCRCVHVFVFADEARGKA